MRARLHVLALALARLRDRDLDQVAHDLLDVAADIADLGELGRLDLEERRARELRQPARNLGLADAGRADHQDVLRQHLLAQLVVELQPPPAVAQRDRDRALGVGLADDEAVELGNDFAREKSRSCVAYHQERDPIGRVDQMVFAESRPFRKRLIARALSGSGSVTTRGVPAASRSFNEDADEGGAMTASDHLRLTDQLIDAARAFGLRAEAGVPVASDGNIADSRAASLSMSTMN